MIWLLFFIVLMGFIVADHKKILIKLKRILSTETNDEHPEALFSGLYTRIEQHLDEIIKAQNKIVLLQSIVNPD